MCAELYRLKPLPLRNLIVVGTVFFAASAIITGCSSLYKSDRSDRGNRDWGDYGEPVYALHALEAHSKHGVIATGTAGASSVGARILEEGGNAVDAAVAAAFALAVTDPGDSGLGGMTLAMVRLAGGKTVAIDGGCKVPLSVDVERLDAVQADSRWKGAPEYVAPPTSLAVLAHMARMYGTIPLRRLIAPAIEIAEGGFTLNRFQRAAIEKYVDGIRGSPELRFMILQNGTELPPPEKKFFRPEFARTLRLIAERGPSEFYYETIARAIQRDLRRLGGFVTRRDLMAVRAREQIPLRTTYRETEVFSFPAPGSGGSALYALNLLEQYPSEILREDTADRLQVLMDVFRIASSDRSVVNQDPNEDEVFRDLSFLDKEHAARRVKVIEPGRRVSDEDAPSRPRCHERDYSRSGGRNRGGDRKDAQQEEREQQTTHVAVIDRFGNMVSMTQTLGNFYGSEILEPKFKIIFNNLLHGTCRPTPGELIASDMSPTIVLRDGKPLLAVGSAGSSRIPYIIAQVISNVVDRGMTIDDAVTAPRVLSSRWRPSVEVYPPIRMRDVKALEETGYDRLRAVRLPTRQGRLINCGGVNAAHYDAETGIMTAVGDPRRSGRAAGAGY